MNIQVKHKKLMAIALLVFVFSFLLPTLFWIRDYAVGNTLQIDSSVLSEYATFLSFVIGFWGLFFNIVLVVIAYRAFINFDVKKEFHNKQLEIVSLLATSMNQTVIGIMICRTSTDPKGEEHLIKDGWEFSLNEIALSLNYQELETLYIRTNNIENTFPFIKYRSHPLLPKTITSELNKLYRALQYLIIVDKSKYPKKYAILSPVQFSENEYSKDWIYTYYKTATDFPRDYSSLRQSILEWYKIYGADNLNI